MYFIFNQSFSLASKLQAKIYFVDKSENKSRCSLIENLSIYEISYVSILDGRFLCLSAQSRQVNHVYYSYYVSHFLQNTDLSIDLFPSKRLYFIFLASLAPKPKNLASYFYTRNWHYSWDLFLRLSRRCRRVWCQTANFCSLSLSLPLIHSSERRAKIYLGI
jgi:hypothetical protein